MKPKDRVKVFLVGFVVGCVIVAYVMKNREFKQRPQELPTTAQAIQQEAVPGILKAYEERRVPMDSDFVKLERVYPIDESHYQRVLILKGEFDDQQLRIEETVQKGSDVEPDQVQEVRVMSANKIRVVLKAEVETRLFSKRVKDEGYRLLRKADNENEYVVSMESYRPETVKDAIAFMLDLKDMVIAAQPDYLDEAFREKSE